MKLRVIVFGALVMSLFAAANAAAMILDAPHNQDNGIYCYSCHSADPSTGLDLWSNPPPAYGEPGYDPDVTRYNWVCDRCHGEFPTDTAHQGPVKKLHSAATTGSDKGPWSTECVNCHDPHFQGQIDWEPVELDNIYVDLGTFDLVVGAVNYDSTDVYSPAFPAKKGGPLGTTSVGIRVSTAGMNPRLWVSKGKSLNNDGVTPDTATLDRATDHSRGLVVVVDKINADKSRTFEIVDVVPSGLNYIIKLNGDARSDLGGNPLILNGQTFGVLYGSSVKAMVKTPTILPNGKHLLRKVKFFTPAVAASAYGGPVDLTGAAEPVGLCQVCHTVTAYFDANTPESVHHDLGTRQCSECHDILVGAAPEITHVSGAVPPFIVANACAGCHVGYDTAPDTAHVGSALEVGCQTCHTAQAPDLNANTLARVGWGANTGLIHGVSKYCTDCHNVTYGGVDYITGHPTAAQNTNKDDKHNAAFAAQTLCVSCHGSPALSTGKTIVENAQVPGGHRNDCGLCHLTVTPAPVELTPIAQRARDINGAILLPVNCAVCHTTYFSGHSHNHSGSVVVNTTVTSKTVNCKSCHIAPTGNGPFVGPTEVHSGSGCSTCHNTAVDGALKGSAAAVNGANPNLISLDGFFECGECHINHFDGHVHTHAVAFNASLDVTTGGSACNVCHRDYNGLATSLGTWAGIIHEHDVYDGLQDRVNVCEVCHNYSTNGNRSGDPDTPLAATVATVIASGTNVTCINCHVKKNTESHGSHVATEFAWTTATRTSCGDDGRAIGACHADNTNTDVIVQIHGNGVDGNCALCHVDVTVNNYTRRTDKIDANPSLATSRSAVCTDCHTTLNHPKPFIHHANNGTVVYTPSTACATLCHNSANSAAGDHTGLVANAPEITDVQKACNTCHTATAGSAGNVPVSVVDNQVHDACTQCHLINATTKVVELVGPSGSVTTMDNIDGTTATNNGGGPCTDCHTGYFEAHSHHNVANQVAINTTNSTLPNYLDLSWGTSQPCSNNGCHNDSGLFLASWSDIKYEHDRNDKNPAIPPGNTVKDGAGACVNCHYNNSRFGANEDKFGIGASIADVVAAGIATNCVDCHFAKRAPDIHGLIYVNHMEINTTGQEGVYGTFIPISDNSGCTTVCHPTGNDLSGLPDPILGLHKNPSCDICHTSQPNLLTTPVNFNQFQQSITLDFNGVDCTECHRDTINLTLVGGSLYHGVTATHAQTQNRHDNITTSNASLGYNCFACHTEMTPAMSDMLTRHMPGFVNMNDCMVCHKPSTYNIAILDQPALAVITDGMSVATGGTGNVVYCESCHTGVGIYQLHGMTDTAAAAAHEKIATSGTSGDTDCANCHLMGTLLQKIQLHTAPLNGANSGDCVTCHNPAAQALAATPSLTVIAAGQGIGGVNQSCTGCHSGSNYLMHGLTNVATATAHEKVLPSVVVGGPSDCIQCHVAADAGARLALHPTCFNNVSCHAAAGTAATVIANGWKTTAPVNANCESCHTGAGVYTLHGMDNTSVSAAHNNLGNAGVTGDTDCANCHTMSTLTEKLNLHVNSVTYGATCLTCHNAGGTAAARITAGLPVASGGSNSPSTCIQCHTGTGIYTMHGLLNADVSTGHDKLLGSTGTGATDCIQCHAAANATARLGLHLNCSQCHTAAGVAVTAITNGVGGTNTNCETCHTGTGVYTLHAMTEAAVATALLHNNITLSSSAGDANCANCHNMTGQLQMMQLHSAPLQTGHNGSCLTCHNPAYEVLSTTPASTVITAGMSLANGGSNLVQYCESCHSGSNYLMHGLTAITIGATHEQMINAFSTTSTCGNASCHPSITPQARVEIHTAATTPTTCLTCHQWGGAVQTQIAYGYNNSGTVPCEACHSTAGGLPNIGNDWYQHAATIHTVTNTTLVKANTATFPTRALCVDCHTGNVVTVVHDSVGVATGNSCAECHTATSALTGSAAPYPAGGECITCHTIYFDGHLQRTVGVGHEIFNYAPATDITTSLAPCGNCHNDAGLTGGTALTTWASVITEHQTVGGVGGKNACSVCHDFAYYGNTNGSATPPLAADVTAAILTDPVVGCKNCHETKTTVFHGGHDAAHWDWTANSAKTCGAAGCHAYSVPGNPEVVGSVHNGAWAQIEYSGNICKNCHNEVPAGSGQDGNTGAGTHNRGTAEITTNLGPANPDPAFHTEECMACHSGANSFDSHLHDHSVELATDGIDSTLNNTLRSQDCDRCHSNTGGAAKAFIGGTTHTQGTTGCQSCHDLPLSDALGPNGTRKSVAANSPTGNFVAGAPADNCDTCHSGGTAYFDSHLARGATGSHAITYDSLTDLSQDGTKGCGAAGCHNGNNADGNGISLDSWRDILSEHNNSCVLCHNYNNGDAAGTPPLADNYSAIDVLASSKCAACHTPKIFPNAGASHGGHAVTDFAWTTAAKTSCGGGSLSVSQGCHDWYNNQNVVTDVHGSGSAITNILGSSAYRHYTNSCRNCHSVNGGGDGNTIGGNAVNGYTGDARIIAAGGPANATTHTETCTTCHTLTIPQTHHERWMSDPAGRNVVPTRPNWVLSGNCYKCHTDANYVDPGKQATYEQEGPARSQVMRGSTNPNGYRPGITPCAFCHMENTTGASGVFRIKKYDLARIQAPNTTAVSAALDPFLNTYTHSIPNRGTAIAIKNSGNCLHCHGATNNRPVNYASHPTLTPVKPRHAWVVGMITIPSATETADYANIPRLRVALHPGHIQYRLMSTQLAPTGNLGAGLVMAERLAPGNEKLYKGTGAQPVGKDSGTITDTRFITQWGVSNLRSLLGDQFMTGGLYAPVATQSVPYTINTLGGPYVVPMNP